MESKNLHKFLIIEDNPGDYFIIEEYLTDSFSFSNIENAKNYSEAKKYLSDPAYAFTMIFLDLTLPDKAGEHLIQNILLDAKDIPVIVLTGNIDIDFGVRSVQLGVADYLNKDELNQTLLYKSVMYTTERIRKKRELEESKKQYRDLFQLSPIPMWVFDFESLFFLDVNEAGIIHYGYSLKEFLSMTIREIKAVEEVEKLESGLNSEELFFKDKFKHVKKDGTAIDVEVQSSEIAFSGRRAILMLANDITEKNNYLNTIEAQNKNLKEIARIQSHVVRSPVARILGLLHCMEECDMDEDEKKIFEDNIKISALELDAIIKDITDKTYNI